MGEAKPWQIAVVVAGVLVLVASLLWQCNRRGVQFADEMTYVDVNTGDLFVTPYYTNKTLVTPAYNPDTKQESLVPVKKNESGQWFLDERARGLVRSMAEARKQNPALPEPKAVSDMDAGTVSTKGTPRSVDLYDVQAKIVLGK